MTRTKTSYSNIFLFNIVLIIFSVCIFNNANAQKGVGARYGTRDPHVCNRNPSTEKSPTIAEAEASIVCNREGEIGNNSLILLENVKVKQIGKGIRYTPGVEFNVDNIDPNFLIYPIRGSFLKYQCSRPDVTDGGKSCRLYEEKNAEGICYKNSFGEWVCSMEDKLVRFSDYTEVAPPTKALK